MTYSNKRPRLHTRKLRNASADTAEKHLWKSLLSRKQMGVNFKRKRPIDRFVVDFFAEEVKLIIEVEARSQLVKAEYDNYRQNRLEALGYSFLRIREEDVLQDLEDVSIKIARTIDVLMKGHSLSELPFFRPSPSSNEGVQEPQMIYEREENEKVLPKYFRGSGLIAG